LTLLSYSLSLSENNNLDQNSFFISNVLWLISTGGALFVTGIAGIAAAVFGTPEVFGTRTLNNKLRQGCKMFLVVMILVMLAVLIAGFLLLAGTVVFSSPLDLPIDGSKKTPPYILYPAVGVALILFPAITYALIR